MKKFIYTIVFNLFAIYSSHGQSLEMATSFGGNGDDFISMVDLDIGNNQILVGGFSDTMDFDPGIGLPPVISKGAYDIYIAKKDQAGNFLWVKSIGGGGNDMVYALTTDASGNIYIGGTFRDTVDFDPGLGDHTLISKGYQNGYLLKLDELGNFVWVNRYGEGTIMEVFGIDVDLNGNLFATGYFTDSIYFENLVNPSVVHSNGMEDAFLLLLDLDGNHQWVRTYGGYLNDRGNCVKADDEGSAYVSGNFENNVMFGQGSNQSCTSQGSKDLFYLKCDEGGDLIWVKSVGGPGIEFFAALEFDNAGYLYSTGSFNYSIDVDPGSGTYTLTTDNYRDVFILKMDTASNFIWAKQFGGTQHNFPNSLSVDLEGNVYSTGRFMGTTAFDTDNGGFFVTSKMNGTYPGYSNDVYVHSLDSSGNFRWVKTYGGDGMDFGISIKEDGQGNIYVLGNFATQVDFSTGTGQAILNSNGMYDVFAIKLNQTLLSLESINATDYLTVFPNPSNGEIQLISSRVLSEVKITMFDSQGRIKVQKNRQNLISENFQLDGPSGLYFLCIESEEETFIIKVIKD